MTQQRRSKLAKWNWIISLIATRIGEIYSLPFVSESQFEWTVWPLAGVTGAFIFPWEKFNFGKCCHSAISVTLVLSDQNWRQPKRYLNLWNIHQISAILALGRPVRQTKMRVENSIVEIWDFGNCCHTEIFVITFDCYSRPQETKERRVKCPISWYFPMLSRIWQEMTETCKTRNNLKPNKCCGVFGAQCHSPQ